MDIFGHFNIFSHSGEISPVLWVIIGCEIGFWILVLGGLSVRYLLRASGISRVILLLVPVLDLVLLAAVALDIHGGADVTTVHRVAGIYLGVTVAFGHSLIAWADARFAHWFADGPAPVKPPKRGMAAVRYECLSFGRWLLAAAIAAGAALLLSVAVASDQQAADLRGIFPMIGIVTVIWLVTGPVWALVESGGRDGDNTDVHNRGGGDRNGEVGPTPAGQSASERNEFVAWRPRGH